MYKLMIADDEQMIQQGLSNAIDWKSYGIEVRCVASNGQEALQMLNAYSPDILILDIKMPIVDGIEVAKTARKILPDIYIIMLTGYADPDYMKRLIPAGVNDYITKSADSSQIIEAVLKGRELLSSMRKNSYTELIQKNAVNTLLPELKNIVMRHLFAGSLSAGQIDELADFLDLDLHSGHYAAFFFPCLEEATDSLVSQLNIAFERKRPSFIASLREGLVAAVFPLSSEEGYAPLKKSVEEANRILNREEYPIFAAPAANSRQDLTRYYLPALRYFDAYPWFSGKGMVNISEDMRTFDEAYFCSLESKILREVFLRDTDTASVLLDVYFTEAERSLMPFGDFTRAMKRIISAHLVLEGQEEIAQDIFEDIGGLTSPGRLLQLVKSYLDHDMTKEMHPAVQNALKYINKNYMKGISLAGIAREIFISPNYLSALFNREMGIGIREYVNRKRIKEAKKLLVQHNELKIYEIAETVGYVNYKSFSEDFLRYTGMSASDYRQLHLPGRDPDHAGG